MLPSSIGPVPSGGIEPRPPASTSALDKPASGNGTRIEYTKPAGNAKPAGVPERTPQTSFDVDLHEPQSGDTYESISKDFYHDVRYGRALAEYNRRKPLQNNGPVEVPPIHVLKKRYPQFLGTTSTSSREQTSSSLPGEFRPAGGSGDAAPVFRTSGSKSYVIPPGGMTMQAVARLTLGSTTRWREIYDLNPQFSTDVPAGAQLKLPADAVVPK